MTYEEICSKAGAQYVTFLLLFGILAPNDGR